MRERLDASTPIGILPIQDTVIDLKCRQALPKIARALLNIYNNVKYRTKILDVLNEEIRQGKNHTGRKGFDLWQIFVLGQFRLGLNLDYDALHDYVNHHSTVRSLMGIHVINEEFQKVKNIPYQTVRDNVNLLTNEMLEKINDIILEFGNEEVFKKKEGEAYILKTDSFVVKSNVHFPTDYNLLYDCMRKGLDMVDKLVEGNPQILGWRKSKNWRVKAKSQSRRVGQISGQGGANKDERLSKEVSTYLDIAKKLVVKLELLLKDESAVTDIASVIIILQLEEYVKLTNKHIDLLERRIIKGETIPHEEKLFSIFEQYTEWINKGKPHVELGKKVCITTDQNQMIVHWKVMNNEVDSQIVKELIQAIAIKLAIGSWSFDKGFYSQENKVALNKVVTKVVMPKKGKCNQAEKEEESDKTFVKKRRKHSAIESNINELEHRGLERCPDRGERHFNRYIALGITAYNLCKIGTALIKQCQNQNPKAGIKLSAAA